MKNFLFKGMCHFKQVRDAMCLVLRSRIYFKCSIFPVLPMAHQPLEGLGLLIIEATLSQSLDTPHSVAVLWTSDQPEAETST